MASNKVWVVKFVAGDPEVFTTVQTSAGGAKTRSEVLADAKMIAGFGWRVWVEHKDDLARRIFESDVERAYRNKTAA